jgi:pilus assembly protein Flp/PilA
MLPYVMAWLSQFEREDEGQGLVEYALIIVLVSIVAVAALGLLGDQVVAVFESITGSLAV